MKINQLIFASKLMLFVIFCLCLVYFLPVSAKADGSDAGNYYNFNDGKFYNTLHSRSFFEPKPSGYFISKGDYFNPDYYGVGPKIDYNRFSDKPYTILYKYNPYDGYNPRNITLNNIINNSNNISYEVNIPNLKDNDAYIDTRVRTEGSISNYFNGSNTKYYGISEDNGFSLSKEADRFAYNSIYGIDNNFQKKNDSSKDGYDISNFYLNNNSLSNFKVSINFNNYYENHFISKDSKIYFYLIRNTLNGKVPINWYMNSPVFEVLRILSYHDLHGDQHNAAVLENREQKVSKDLNEELSNLQKQINNDPQYDSNTQNYLDKQVRNICNKNENHINHYVQQIVHRSRNYSNDILSNLNDQKFNTIQEMKDLLSKKVLSIDSIPNLNFGTQSLSYMGNTIARIQNSPVFKIRSFNNSNWRMNLSLSDMTDGKDTISSKYFQGNNSSYNNKNKTFNFSGKDGVKDISLNNISIKIPNNIRLHSGNYRGTATWNLVNGPK
ncbi:hypothetical protein [Apilactobacillus micheneri]|uniref:hypothetical protein n=1 Tax=Apilactobacillus micheneri TaxID=1899430 RepID=UPI00112B79D1|nr:hypothetical protein [Apilactobacillus micheneri]TPR39745.1 hypothetical protein DY119_04015 [Apilactobacillus micheneri]